MPKIQDYTVVLLDDDGCELSNQIAITLKEAKEFAGQRVNDPEYIKAGAYKVEVRDEKGVCIFDRFVKKCLTF